MNRTLIAGTLVLVAFASGCARDNGIVGHRLTQTGTWYEELGITGHLNKITVRGDSRLTTLSIIGDGNEVHVEHGATLGKIEVWGARNVIEVPAWLNIRKKMVGNDNRVVPYDPPRPGERPIYEAPYRIEVVQPSEPSEPAPVRRQPARRQPPPPAPPVQMNDSTRTQPAEQMPPPAGRVDEDYGYSSEPAPPPPTQVPPSQPQARPEPLTEPTPNMDGVDLRFITPAGPRPSSPPGISGQQAPQRSSTTQQSTE